MSDQGDALAVSTAALQGEVAGLRQDVDRLGQRTDGLRSDLTSVADRTSRTEGSIRWVAIGAVVAFLLAAGIGLAVYRGVATDRRVDAVCPVLALVVGGYDPSTRPAGDARARYEASFDVMRQAYVDLGCTQPLVPPRSTP